MLKKVCLLVMTILLLVNISAVPVYGVETENQDTVTAGCKGIDGKDPYLGKGYLVGNIESALLYELRSDSLLYAYDADAPQYPASFVKIMTALLVLEQADLSDVVTVSQTAVDSISYQDISVDLVAGEQISVEDLLYCMMVKSANDAAVVLAEHVSGSQDEFVKRMNDKAVALGCRGTNYVNASGLHDPEQVTTARDTCRILQAALQNDFFRTLFGTVHYTVSPTNMNPEERSLSSGNLLMNPDQQVIKYIDGRVTGGRTGVTSEGFRCVASLAEERNMEVICIVMGSASTYAENGNTEVYGGFPETIELLNQAFNGNSVKQIIYKDQNLKQISVENGDCDLFIASSQAISTILDADYTLKNLDYVYSYVSEPLKAPIIKGQIIGSVRVMDGDICVAQTELYAANDVPIAFSKAGTYIDVEKKNFVWLIILVAVVVLAAGGFVFYRIKTKRKKQERELAVWRGEQ